MKFSIKELPRMRMRAFYLFMLITLYLYYIVRL